MELAAAAGEAKAFEGGLLVFGRHADASPSAAEAAVDGALGGALGRALERQRFRGRPRQVVGVDTLGRIGAERVAVIGLGPEGELTPAALRDLGAIAIERANTLRLATVGLVLPTPDAAAAEQVALGALLGAYRFDDYKAEPDDGPAAAVERFELIGDTKPDLDRVRALADAINLARTLTNEPPNVCTPERLAALAREIAQAPGVTATIFDKAEIYARKMGGVIGVSRGAAVEPRFIHLAYVPEGHDGQGGIALVGKGITFDSGGLSIKPAKGMADMYIDMAGAAAVLCTMQIVAALRPAVPVHCVVGACENMTGADAYRPSDILTMYGGQTVEVVNTDAEGRLVLADALHYVTELEPPVRGVVDVATLTGACMVALGIHYAGAMSDDEAFCAEVLAAAEAVDEKLWRLPLDPKLAKTLESKRADLKNLGGPYGGAITAAQFLAHFKGELPWVHLDVAGAVLAEKDDAHIRAGGTGFGVLTLWRLIEAAGARAGV